MFFPILNICGFTIPQKKKRRKASIIYDPSI